MATRIVGVERHLPHRFSGKVDLLAFESDLLAGNPLGDPTVRELVCYTPPEPAPGMAVLFVLPAFTSRPHAALETHPWRRGLVADYDRSVAAGTISPALLVLPDCFTRLGGSQYVNSPAVGPYESHVIEELLPLAREHLEADQAGPRGILGKSSGGFGALHLSMRHAGSFRACASISGDCGFDALFPPEFLNCLRGLLQHDGDPAKFLDSFFETPDLSGDGHAMINVLAMAACFSPNADSPLGFDLPFELDTGEVIPSTWQRWLEFDPLVACERSVAALKDLDLLHIECGLSDEFHLQWGARRLSKKLRDLGVDHTHEEHAGGHRGIDERVLMVIDRMARRLGR